MVIIDSTCFSFIGHVFFSVFSPQMHLPSNGRLKVEIRWAISGSNLNTIQAHSNDTVRALEQQILPQVGAGTAVKLVFEGRVLAPQERLGEVLSAANNSVLDVIFRRSQVFTASMDGNIKIWGTSQGECQATLVGHQSAVTSLALSADNQYLVSGSEDCTARIWDVETLECQHVLSEHFEAVHAVAISPDQRRRASEPHTWFPQKTPQKVLRLIK